MSTNVIAHLIREVHKGLRAYSECGYPLTKFAFPRILDTREAIGSSPVPPTIKMGHRTWTSRKALTGRPYTIPKIHWRRPVAWITGACPVL